MVLLATLWMGATIVAADSPSPLTADAGPNQVIIPPGGPVEIATTFWFDWAGLQDWYDAMQLAFYDYGSIQGFGLQRNDYDGGCDETAGAVAATAVVSHTQNVGVIGPLCSSSTRGGAPILEAAGVVMISPSNTAADLGTYGPTVFNRVVLADPEFTPWDYRVSFLPSVYAWESGFETLYGHRPEQFARYVYDATTLLLTRLDEVSTVDGDGNLVIDRAELANAVRNTAGFAGITGDLTLEVDGDR
ncbi:MAG: hypothetical protein AB1791_03780, partial [Chloroflexota bacterium]